MLLAMSPDDVILRRSIEANLLQVYEADVEMIPKFAPVFGSKTHGKQLRVAIQIGVNEQIDHRFSPPVQRVVGAVSPSVAPLALQRESSRRSRGATPLPSAPQCLVCSVPPRSCPPRPVRHDVPSRTRQPLRILRV